MMVPSSTEPIPMGRVWQKRMIPGMLSGYHNLNFFIQRDQGTKPGPSNIWPDKDLGNPFLSNSISNPAPGISRIPIR
jgi:hypothetical protein